MGFICQYCGIKKPWEERHYDMGLYLAQLASFGALGYTEGPTTPYLICEQCSEEIKNDEKAT